jgi:8-oxo-dGTP diphosphatase
MTPVPSVAGLRIREAARAIVRAPGQRVLLVRFEFPEATRWALPGGGLDPGEDHETALRRELREELGLHANTIGPHVWSRLHVVPFVDGSFDGQRERIHLVDVAEVFDPQPALGWPQLNAEHLFELRWWHVDEIEAAAHLTFVPGPLAALLRALAADGPPNPPVDVPI